MRPSSPQYPWTTVKIANAQKNCTGDPRIATRATSGRQLCRWRPQQRANPETQCRSRKHLPAVLGKPRHQCRRADLRSVSPLRANTSQKLVVRTRSASQRVCRFPDLVALKEQTQPEGDEQAGCPERQQPSGSAPRWLAKPTAMKPCARKAAHAPNNTGHGRLRVARNSTV